MGDPSVCTPTFRSIRRADPHLSLDHRRRATYSTNRDRAASSTTTMTLVAESKLNRIRCAGPDVRIRQVSLPARSDLEQPRAAPRSCSTDTSRAYSRSALSPYRSVRRSTGRQIWRIPTSKPGSTAPSKTGLSTRSALVAPPTLAVPRGRPRMEQKIITSFGAAFAVGMAAGPAKRRRCRGGTGIVGASFHHSTGSAKAIEVAAGDAVTSAPPLLPQAAARTKSVARLPAPVNVSDNRPPLPCLSRSP